MIIRGIKNKCHVEYLILCYEKMYVMIIVNLFGGVMWVLGIPESFI